VDSWQCHAAKQLHVSVPHWSIGKSLLNGLRIEKNDQFEWFRGLKMSGSGV
jgi:hypothetical protein